tara:strand:- start:352 stop:1212 length:861 start_codon:yes stop_codon:yes gene_type:complete
MLITGGCGQLGLSLHSFFKSSYNVISTSRVKSEKSVQLDVSDKLEVARVFEQHNPDIIINCASFNNVDDCEKNKKKARGVIFDGLQNLILNSRKDSILIHISSDYIFRGDKDKYLESDSPDPLNYYGRLKLESENLLRSSNREYLILRCNVVFSHILDNKSNFFAWVYKNLKNNQEISVVSDQISNPTPVELLAKVIEASIILKSNGIYNVGTLDPISRYNFALKICNCFNFDKLLLKKIESNSLNQVAKRPRNTFLDIEKTSKTLDIDIYSLDYYLKNIRDKINE